MTEENLKPDDLCMITGCTKHGYTIANLAGMEMKYCKGHMDYGNRVLNFFINARTGNALNKFLKETRDDWFMSNQPILSKESELAIKEYLEHGIERIEKIKELGKYATPYLIADGKEPELE